MLQHEMHIQIIHALIILFLIKQSLFLYVLGKIIITKTKIFYE